MTLYAHGKSDGSIFSCLFAERGWGWMRFSCGIIAAGALFAVSDRDTEKTSIAKTWTALTPYSISKIYGAGTARRAREIWSSVRPYGKKKISAGSLLWVLDKTKGQRLGARDAFAGNLETAIDLKKRRKFMQAVWMQ